MRDPLVPGPANPLPDDPVESFLAMEEEISKLGSDTELGDPILPCEKPYLEVWLLDEELQPVQTECYVSLPTGKRRDGPLDQAGYIKFDDFLVDEQDVVDTMAQVAIEDDRPAALTFEAEKIDSADEPEESGPVAPPELYFAPMSEDW